MSRKACNKIPVKLKDEEPSNKKLIERNMESFVFISICSGICNSCDVGQNSVGFHSGLPEYIQVIMIVEKLYMASSVVTAMGLSWYESIAEKLQLSEEDRETYPIPDKINDTKASIDGMLNQIKDFALKSEEIRRENEEIRRENEEIRRENEELKAKLKALEKNN